MSHKPLWYTKQIPVDICNLATNEFLKYPPIDASMGQNGETSDHTKRNTVVRFITQEHWFNYLMQGVATEANRICKWNYEINRQEDIQFAEYGVGQHYDWHVDVFPLSHAASDRKISVVCLLSEPTDFEGGDLELRLYGDHKAPLVKGTIIAFPSIIEHRVTPVISGLRRSAVIWLTGPRFK